VHVQDVKYFDQDVLDNHLVHLTKQSNAECLNCITCSLNFLALILLLCLQIKDSRDESGSGRFSGVFSSSGSPRLGFSRSSSRLSMQDDTDDADFPFAVDDVDPDSRPGYVRLLFHISWIIMYSCNRKVPGSSPSLCTFVWVRLGA